MGTRDTKVYRLADDGRMTPATTLRNLLEDLEAGKLKIDRMVIVTQTLPERAVEVFGSGPGMGDGVVAAGMLQAGLFYLARQAEEG